VREERKRERERERERRRGVQWRKLVNPHKVRHGEPTYREEAKKKEMADPKDER
jgi:hypothetical protein